MFYAPNSTLEKSGMDMKIFLRKLDTHSIVSSLSASPSGDQPLQYFEGNYKAEEELFIEKLTEETRIGSYAVCTTKRLV